MPDPIQMLIEIALQEDIGSGDITTQALFGEDAVEKKGVIVAKQDLVLSGLDVARRVFLTVDHHLDWKSEASDGDSVAKDTMIARIQGRLQSLLRAERTALNFLQHLSGIATQTQRYVAKVKDFPAKILDTRKTIPGLRLLEKRAVRDGGGVNHRAGLFDQFLVKDNHLMGRSITEAVRLAKESGLGSGFVEVEVDALEQIEEAVMAGADRILLDNFSPENIQKAVSQVAGRTQTEASGGIHLENILDYAKSGVDFISIGALTHSAPAADLSLEVRTP